MIHYKGNAVDTDNQIAIGFPDNSIRSVTVITRSLLPQPYYCLFHL